MSKILDGKKTSQRIKEEIKIEVTNTKLRNKCNYKKRIIIKSLPGQKKKKTKRRRRN